MSHEPESAAHRWGQTHGGHAGYFPEEKPEPPAQPTRAAQRKRKFRVVVEPEKPKPKPPTPTRGYYTARNREEAVTKMATTTEALTADERALLKQLRDHDAGHGLAPGTLAGNAAARITELRGRRASTKEEN